MKNLILVFFIILSSWAQANMSYESGQYYAQKGSVSTVCGNPFVDEYGVCVVPCQEAQWYQDCGGGFVNIRVCGPYGCSWESRFSNGCRWSFNWIEGTKLVHPANCWR